eukprot:14694340-Alexandrium_andersonii.AAC.1
MSASLVGSEMCIRDRPIAIAPVVVRAWARCRTRQLTSWLGPIVPGHAAGGIRGRSAEGVLAKLFHRLEL